MEKIDLRTALKHLYQPRAGEVVEVDVPRMNFLKIDGCGDPNTSKDYSSAVLRIAKLDVDYWGSAAVEAAAPADQKGRFAAAKRAIAAYGDRLQPCELSAELTPGIRSVAAAGHTPGHSCCMVSSGGAPSGLSCSRWRRARTS